MKTILKTLVAGAAALAAFACAKAPETAPAGETTVTLTASIADASEPTKLAVDNLGKLTWEANDAIGVYDSEGNYKKFALKSGEGTATATFEGTISAGSTISFAIFPYYGLDSSLDGTNLSLTLPNTYDLLTSNAKIPMFGKPSGNNLSFTHLCGAIRFTFKGVTDQAYRLRFFTNKKINGNYTISTTADTPEIVAESSTETYTDVIVAAPGDFETAKTIDLIVPTGTYDNFAIRIFNATGSVPITGKSNAVTQSSNVVNRKGLLEMPELDLRPFHEDFETNASWSIANTSLIDNPVSTTANSSSKVMQATAYFTLTIPQTVAPFQYLRASNVKRVRCKYYAGSAAGSGFPCLRNGDNTNPYLLPARVNGVALTDENRATIFSSSDWNIIEWDVTALAGQITFRPFTDATGASIAIPDGTNIYFDDFETLLQ